MLSLWALRLAMLIPKGCTGTECSVHTSAGVTVDADATSLPVISDTFESARGTKMLCSTL